jgi:hypothetical protein
MMAVLLSKVRSLVIKSTQATSKPCYGYMYIVQDLDLNVSILEAQGYYIPGS